MGIRGNGRGWRVSGVGVGDKEYCQTRPGRQVGKLDCFALYPSSTAGPLMTRVWDYRASWRPRGELERVWDRVEVGRLLHLSLGGPVLWQWSWRWWRDVFQSHFIGRIYRAWWWIWGCGVGKRKGGVMNNQISFEVCFLLSPPTYPVLQLWVSIQPCEPISPPVRINDTNLGVFIAVLNEVGPIRLNNAQSLQSCPTLCNPMDCNLCPWDSPGKNTGVGCHALLQRIFPTRESNSRLPASPALQMDSLPTEPPGNSRQTINISVLISLKRSQRSLSFLVQEATGV